MEEEDIRKIADIDLYEILNVKIEDNIETIKKKYRKLVLLHHPDKNNNERDYFELITLAYTILADDDYRELYDKIRNNYISDFISLKYEKKKEVKLCELDTYQSLSDKLNKEHGYVEENIPDSRELNKKLNETILNRTEIIREIKFEPIKEKPIINMEIVAFNDSNTLLNSIKNYNKLYDTGPSLFEECFEISKMPVYVEEKIDFNKKIKEYESLFK